MRNVCCFSGYRPEKMPSDMPEGSPAFQDMLVRLQKEILSAAEKGYCHFLTGMSRGFDLWAAEVVLSLQKSGVPIDLWEQLPFPACRNTGSRNGRIGTTLPYPKLLVFFLSPPNILRNATPFVTAFWWNKALCVSASLTELPAVHNIQSIMPEKTV